MRGLLLIALAVPAYSETTYSIDTSAFVDTSTPQGISASAPKTFFASVTVAALKVTGSEFVTGDIILASGAAHVVAGAAAASGSGASTVTFRAGDGAIGSNATGGELNFYGGNASQIGPTARVGGPINLNVGRRALPSGGCIGTCPDSAAVNVGNVEITHFNVWTGSASFGGVSRSTFNVDASSYSLVLSSGIFFTTQLTGIQFADGTVSTTAVIGGGATITNYVTTNTDQLVSGVKTFSSTVTLQANNFSVGGSSFVVLGSSVGIRTSSPLFALDVRGPVAFGGVVGSGRFATNGDFSFSGTALYRVATNGAAFVSDAFPLAGFFFDAAYGGFTSRSVDGNTYASIALLGADSSYAVPLGVNLGINPPTASAAKGWAFYVNGKSLTAGNVNIGVGPVMSTQTATTFTFAVGGSSIVSPGPLMISSAAGSPGLYVGSLSSNTFVAIDTSSFQDPGIILHAGRGAFGVGVSTQGEILTKGIPPVSVSGCGASPTIQARSNSIKGRVTIGTVPTTACVVTFNNPYAKFAPVCFCNNDVTSRLCNVTAETTNGFTMNGITIASDVLSYFCIGDE